MAALLTRMSTLPNRSTVSSSSALTCSSSLTSQVMPMALPPSSCMRFTVVLTLPDIRKSPSFSVRAETTTWAPSLANTRAMSRPIAPARAGNYRNLAVQLAHDSLLVVFVWHV